MYKTLKVIPIASALALLLGFSSASAQVAWGTGTWAAAPYAAPAGSAGKTDETLREIVHVSLGSVTGVSIVLSNEFGTDPLTIAAASVARRTSAGSTSGIVALTFAGLPGVTIAPGKSVASDPARFNFPAHSDIAVSLFVPAQTITKLSMHGFANSTNYSAPGDQTTAVDLTGAKEMSSWRFLKELKIPTFGENSLVCFGDSITDGSKSTRDANLRWPDLLSKRLSRYGILNEGIGGNRILHDNTGPAGIDRFERDVLGHDGGSVAAVVILLGINDIGHAYDPDKPYDVVSAEDLIAGYRYMAARAHNRNIRVIGATLTPYVGAKYQSDRGEEARQKLNAWIRTSKDLDGVIDFDKATRDPANPGRFLPAFDSGDHLHPNDAGMRAMAAAIDLTLFE